MPEPSRSLVARYAFALLAAAVALLLTWLLQPLIAPSIFAFCSAAALLSTVYGGRGPGRASAVTGALGAAYFLIPPPFSLALAEPREWTRLGIYLASSLLTVEILEVLRLARQRAEASAAAALREVAERRQVEEALRRSERLYRAIGELIDYGVWVCDPDGRNTYASESFLRFRGADGRWHPILARGVPIRDEEGQIECWAGINLDISALKESEERFRQLAENIRAVFFMTEAATETSAGRLLYVSPAYDQIWGWLVKGLVALHGGEVRGRSDGPGRGSEFVVDLPVDWQAPAPGPGPVPPRPLDGPIRVLIVEDNRDAAESLRDLLELHGCTVELVFSGLEAPAAARRFRPEVVFCDLGLPGMDGYRVAAALRQDSTGAAARLIAISGYGQEEDRERSRQAGFDLHLTKPVDFAELKALLEIAPRARGA